MKFFDKNRYIRKRRFSVFFLLCLLFLCAITPAFSFTLVGVVAGEEKIRVNVCDEAGSRCDSGDDCHNGVCNNPCREGGNPFCSCDCYLKNEITLVPVEHVTPNPDPNPDDGSWVLVVGGMAVLAAAMFAAIQKIRSKPKKENEPPRTTYLLQLSRNELTVSTTKKDSFMAKAWIVDETGRYAPAHSAAISLSLSPRGDGLSVSPASGMGEVVVTVSLRKPVDFQKAVINVEGQAGGSGISGRVTVNIEPELQVGFE